MLKLSTIVQSALLLSAMTLSACGAQDASQTTSKIDATTIAGPASLANDDELESLYTKATWLFQCPDSPFPVPTPGNNEIVLVDAGPFQFSREKLVHTPFSIKGKLCPAERLNRDAIFIVDVSSSMDDNDPQYPDPLDATKQTCGRFESYKAIMASMPVATTNFAVITFGSSVIRASSRLFTTQADLESDISQNGTVPLLTIFCENPSGTAYAPALARAKQLFTNSRLYATKEIYFLTDGEPLDSYASELAATDLKTSGVVINGEAKLVTIATVMLGSTSPVFLRDKIASKDSSGVPIHANAANAADLARLLDGLTDNKLDGAKLVHGGNGAPTPTAIDLMQIMDPVTLEFQIPSSMLAIDFAQSEYQMKFEYWDTHLNRYTVVGRLTWTDR